MNPITSSEISNAKSQIASPSPLRDLRDSVVNPIRAQLGVEVTPDSADPDLLHIRASDQTLDRYKEVILASGWRLENYSRNPVIQNAHQYGDIIFTIGRAEKTWVSGNALLQTWRFASNENPFAKIARDLYRGKFLQAASVGFIPLKWEDADPNPNHNLNPNQGFTRRYTEQELIEVSAVGIPANPNALTLALRAGAVEPSDVRELYSLLKHLVGRNSVEPSAFGVPPSGGPDSALRVPRSAFEPLLPDLRFLHSLMFHNSTLNRKEP
jgi:prohead serine protease